eukprot:c10151_g1_i2.p1 GENE.c10151_g1_i2~~c10151_g1_i2.p1  ORF type:complete len:296 (+),score=45.82 c10151_g1_i2:33-920(+)
MELRQAVDWGRLFLSSKDEISASNQAGLPFNVCLISKELGRGCFANQTILVNTVILFTRPLASVLRDEFVRDHCSFCFCPVGLNTCCGVCDSCNFCSSCASRGAFEWHVLECGWMMKSPESTRQIGGVFPTEFLRFSFRYLATLDSPCSFQGFDAAHLKHVCSNLQCISDERSRAFALYAAIVSGITGHSRKELYALYARRTFNAHAIPGGKGWILSPIASFFNHSCRPNTVVTVNQTGCLIARTTHDLAFGDELVISYVDHTAPYTQRQEQLQSKFCFDCRCGKCLAEQQTVAV